MNKIADRYFFLRTYMIDLTICIGLLHCQHCSFHCIGNKTESSCLVMSIYFKWLFSFSETDNEMWYHMFETHTWSVYIMISHDRCFKSKNAGVIQKARFAQHLCYSIRKSRVTDIFNTKR